eukprot:15081102-Alexandrium_andersonii.AAC.1
MSASLVGSEMCIRDSRRKLQEIAGNCKKQQETAGNCRKLQEIAGNCRKPVSYTHLTLPTICSV